MPWRDGDERRRPLQMCQHIEVALTTFSLQGDSSGPHPGGRRHEMNLNEVERIPCPINFNQFRELTEVGPWCTMSLGVAEYLGDLITIPLSAERRVVEILVNSAIKAQLSTLPEAEQIQTDAMLQRLGQDFPGLPNLKRLRAASNLWELRISSRLRALVRIENDRANVLAVARPDQLQRYWRRELAS